MKHTGLRLVLPSLLLVLLVTLFLDEYYGGWSWLSSSGWSSVGAVLLGLAYFAVLMVVALERPWSGRQGRHRRGLLPEGA